MEAVPDDIFQHDLHTMPHGDPAVLAKQAQLNAAAEKEMKAREAAQAKERKAEEARVKKAMAMPTGKQRDSQELLDMKAARARELMVRKISLYYSKLGHKLSSKPPKAFPRDDTALAELLAGIEAELQSQGGVEQAATGLIAFAKVVEQVNATFNPLGLMLSGPRASLASSIEANRKEWDELVTEFAISNAEWFCVGPGKRLLMFVVQVAMAVDSANKGAVNASRVVSQKEKSEVEDL